MSWLGTWANRLKLTISSAVVDATLTDFPVMVKLSTASGIGDVDASPVFDELGPTASNNEFSADPNCVALWRFENGALTTDTIGSNTLTDNATVATETSDYKEGTACADFEKDNSEFFSITDANLDAGFPLKNGVTTPSFSICGWFKAESVGVTQFLIAKYDYGNNKRSLFINITNLDKFSVYIGYNAGASAEELYNDTTLVAGRWYHYGFTFADSDKSWKLVVWDDTGSNKVINASGTATNNISIEDSPFSIGARITNGSPEKYFDGLIDETVVFKDILTTGEIDAIRTGSYNNRKKIAVTSSDGTTELYCEIEKWDDANELAWLHIKVPSISSSADTIIYLYYDSAQADNTTYIGDTTDAVTHNVWDSDFAAVWHMAQDPNGDAADAIKDSTSNANDGTPVGAMTTSDLVDGKVGKGIEFDESNDYILIGADATLKFGTGDFSVESIFKTSSTNSLGIVSYGDRADNPGWNTNINTSAAMALDDGTTQVVISDSGSYADSTFYHIALTLDRDANGVQYIDGVATDTTDISGANLTLDTTDHDEIVLGAVWYNNVYGNLFSGVMDEVRISNTARSAAWIKATYNSLWDSLITFSNEQVNPDDWANRLELTIDSSLIDTEDQTDFPVMIKLSTASGIGDFDASPVFDELASDGNRKKIAVTDENNQQLYCEIELWDDANEIAILHVKVPSVAYDADTILYFYYDSAQADNTTYIGDTTDAVTHNVWDANFVGVWHMAQDPNGDTAGAIKDSTSNANDGTPAGSMTTADLISGQVGKAIDFDATDYITVDGLAADIQSDTDGTIEIIQSIVDNTQNSNSWVGIADSGDAGSWIIFKQSGAGGNGAINLSVYEANSSIIELNTTNNEISTGTFYSCALTVDSSGNKLYKNGTQITAITYSTGDSSTQKWCSDIGDIDSVIIGGVKDSGTVYSSFAGIIDEVRISSTARSAAWIKATYNSLWDSLITFSSDESSINVIATTVSLIITPNTAIINTSNNIIANTAQLIITPQPAIVTTGSEINVIATTAQLIITPNTAIISTSNNIIANTAQLIITPNTTTINTLNNVIATTAQLIITTISANITLSGPSVSKILNLSLENVSTINSISSSNISKISGI